MCCCDASLLAISRRALCCTASELYSKRRPLKFRISKQSPRCTSCVILLQDPPPISASARTYCDYSLLDPRAMMLRVAPYWPMTSNATSTHIMYVHARCMYARSLVVDRHTALGSLCESFSHSRYIWVKTANREDERRAHRGPDGAR